MDRAAQEAILPGRRARRELARAHDPDGSAAVNVQFAAETYWRPSRWTVRRARVGGACI